jgi:hypothetical protein
VGSYAATIVGAYQLDLIVSDRDQTRALDRRPVIDVRLADFVERFAEKVPQVSPSHRADFEAALEAVLSFQDMVFRSGKYKERDNVQESELQDDLFEYLHARLGGDHLRQKGDRAAGEFDIEYRSITVELKVERDDGTVDRLIPRYTSQPTQYMSADGQQLGIVLILDVTKKEAPPGDLRNYLGFNNPKIHGYGDGEELYHTGVAVIIVPGALRSPSAYS